ncbi:MAG: hypothetical protein ACRDF8_05610, partial [Chloroflexota bacterium]
MTIASVPSIERFVKEQRLPLVTFKKGQRKGRCRGPVRARAQGRGGCADLGKAQERHSAVKSAYTWRRGNRDHKARHPPTTR